jgi:hypothetical protein
MSTTKGWLLSSAILAWVIAALLSAASAFGAAVVQDSKGDVRAGTTPAQSKPVGPNQRVLSGTSVITAPGSRVTLRFDDGQVVALHENTEFRIVEFYYRPQEPTADRAIFSLLRGALRVVTGALGKRNRDAFALHVAQATIGIRGTDFMVAIVNPAYLSVLKGTVAATNVAGTVAFEAETFGSIATSSTLAVSIPASVLPSAAASAFRSLGALPITPVDLSADVVPANASAGEIKLPGTAAPQAHDAASFGLETANRARELKGDLGREFGKEVSVAARERARDRVPPNPKRQ